MQKKSYVLITAARNEEGFIENLITSVNAQSIRPKKWVIVSDGSTDSTDEIVTIYASDSDFIDFLRLDRHGRRNFGSKAHAINAGYKNVQGVAHDFVGILDADVSLEPSYYERIMEKFAQHPTLGIAGGVILDDCNGTYLPQRSSQDWSVGGPIQMFRRDCFVAIGGYRPMTGGGVDAVAEVMARMQGWKVRTFPDVSVLHQRQTGTANQNIWRALFRLGAQDYGLGYHPLFMLLRGLYQSLDRAHIGGGGIMLGGYFWAAMRRTKRSVPQPFVRYLRREQMSRLRSIVSRRNTPSE